jgi:hypothetical protein
MILNCSKRSGNLTARQRIQADADRALIDSTSIGQKHAGKSGFYEVFDTSPIGSKESRPS